MRRKRAAGRLRGARLVCALAMALSGAGGAARAQDLPAAAPLTVRLGAPADTMLFPPDERLPLVPRVNRDARVLATLAAADVREAAVWRSDTLPPGAGGRLLWDLRGADGRLVAAGRYVLTLTARDSLGNVARAEEVLIVTRLRADTQRLPAPLRASVFEPETLMVGQTTPWAIFIGASAVLIPRLLGRAEMSAGRGADAGAWLVAGSVTVAGFVAFLKGRRPEYSRENARHNAEMRRQYEQDVAAVAAQNAEARAVAPYRIQRERPGP